MTNRRSFLQLLGIGAAGAVVPALEAKEQAPVASVGASLQGDFKTENLLYEAPELRPAQPAFTFSNDSDVGFYHNGERASFVVTGRDVSFSNRRIRNG